LRYHTSVHEESANWSSAQGTWQSGIAITKYGQNNAIPNCTHKGLTTSRQGHT